MTAWSEISPEMFRRQFLDRGFVVARCRECRRLWLLDTTGEFRCPHCLAYDGDHHFDLPQDAEIESRDFWAAIAEAAMLTSRRWAWPEEVEG